MTANRISPLLKPAEASRCQRLIADVRLRPIATPAPPGALKSSALQQPNRGMRSPAKPRSPINVIVHNRQAHRRGHGGPSKTVRSP
jgi:hypothetical protein